MQSKSLVSSSGRAVRAAVAIVACATGLTALPAYAVDPVVFSFATVGDSRQDPAAPDPTTLIPTLSGTLLPQDAIWLQNTKPFARILRSIQAQKPNLLFFNGDMIYGYGRAVVPTFSVATPANPSGWAGTSSTTVTADYAWTYLQYGYWRGMVANMFETNTYVVPVPGNHETQCNPTKYPYSSTNKNPGCSTATGATAYVDNENAWRANMGDLIQDLVTNTRFQAVSGFAATNVSGLTQASAPGASTYNGQISTNQAQLSYSFDVVTSAGRLHFAVVNTDPTGADGTAPADWLAADLATAKTNGAVRYFVFGHKPAFTYQYGGHGVVGAAGLDASSVFNTAAQAVTLRNQFWKVIAQYGATYFCGHEHSTNVAAWPDLTNTYSTAPYQVLVGAGGSPWDDKMNGTSPNFTEPTVNYAADRYYAWATVQVHASGAVNVVVNGFSDAFGPTQALTLYNVSL